MLVTCDQASDPDHMVDIDQIISPTFGTSALFIRAALALNVQCDGDRPSVITILLGKRDKPVGLFAPMTSATARGLAHGLLRCADMVDAAAAQSAAEVLARAKGGAK